MSENQFFADSIRHIMENEQKVVEYICWLVVDKNLVTQHEISEELATLSESDTLFNINSSSDNSDTENNDSICSSDEL